MIIQLLVILIFILADKYFHILLWINITNTNKLILNDEQFEVRQDAIAASIKRMSIHKLKRQ